MCVPTRFVELHPATLVAAGGHVLPCRVLPFCPRPRELSLQRLNRHCRSTRTAAALPPEVAAILNAVWTPHPGVTAGTLANAFVYVAGIKVLLKGLTVAGIAHSFFLGASIFSAFGPGGYLLVCLYFIVGSLVTKVKLAQKQKEGIAEARSGRRGPASVWGSGLAATACAVTAIVTQTYSPWQVGFVASLCSKLADTVSSEIGKAYGKTTYLVTTFQKVPRGTEGAVSLEGSLAGVVAALGLAAVALAVGQVDLSGACITVLAATLANLFESWLGAVEQGQLPWLTNDLVNMIQISLAALIAMGLTQLHSQGVFGG